MKFRKIVAAVAAAAAAVSMMAVSVFAGNVALDSEYPGAWGASKTIPKTEFEAVGGDVKVVLSIEAKEPLIGDHNHLAKPMNICVSWDAITDNLTSDTAVAKSDGFFVISEGQTTLEFVVPESVWQCFYGYDEEDAEGNAGLAFQVCDVIIKSADLSAASGAEGEIRRVTEEQSGEIMSGKSYEEVTGTAAAPAETAPAGDTGATTPAATGNVPVAAAASVMAVAGIATVAAKKRK